jgi:hypothetical protein
MFRLPIRLLILVLIVPNLSAASKPLERPGWSERGKVLWGGNLHEPLAFYRRENRPMAGVAANALWLSDWYGKVRSPKVLTELAATGSNLIYINFAKGAAGNEKFEDLAGARKLVKNCHNLGIRVLAYLQFASKHIEEFPEAERWRAIHPDGRGRTYGGTYYRGIMCPLKPGYVDYLKSLIRKAVVDYGIDGVFLDNCYYDGCHCEYCQQDFRQYVRSHFANPLEELGIVSLDNLSIPQLQSDEQIVTERLHQAWLSWRVGIVSSVCQELRDYCRELNPEALFSGNIIYPRMNNWHLRGVDVYNYIRLFDIAYAEGHNFPRWENGIAVNSAPPMIMACAAGSNLLPGVWLPGTVLPDTPDQIALNLGESLAYGGHVTAGIWALRMKGRKYAASAEQLSDPYFSRPEIKERWTGYNSFMLENEKLYAGSKLTSPLAVYHSEKSMAYDFSTAYPAFINATQGLLQNQLPYDILFSQDIERLDGFNTLLVCSQRCLSQSEIDSFGAFVKRGGTLIVTGESGLFDLNRRERPDYGMAELTGASLFDINGKKVLVKKSGKGKTVFFREALELDGVNTGSTTVHRATPDDFTAVVDSARAAVEDMSPAVVDGPGSLGCSLFRTADGRLAVHLLNYDNSNELSDIRLTCGSRVINPQLLSPDGKEYETIRITDSNTVLIPRLKTYSVCVFPAVKQ